MPARGTKRRGKRRIVRKAAGGRGNRRHSVGSDRGTAARRRWNFPSIFFFFSVFFSIIIGYFFFFVLLLFGSLSPSTGSDRSRDCEAALLYYITTLRGTSERISKNVRKVYNIIMLIAVNVVIT